MRNLHGFRRTGLYLIGRLYPGVEGEFLKGILLGYSDLIPEEVEQSFRSSGIRHILAISGYHVSLVVLVVYQGLRGLYMSRNKAIPITLITILGFVLVTGAAASTIRAGVLAGILLISEWLGRYVAGLRPLALTACLMLVVQPLWGAYSLGFQLSFLAVVGILVFSDVMTTFSQGMAATRIREYTGETVAAQIMVTPLLLWSFGEISLVSILGNVLIIPFIPLIMLGGVVSVLVYSVVPFQIIGYPVYLLIQVVLWLTDTVASIPFAMVGIDGGDWNLLLGGYFLIGVGYGLMRWKKHTRVPPKDRA